MLLRRFAYPCRLSDMIVRFGRPVPVVSMITKEVMNFIYNNHQQRVTQWNQFLLTLPLCKSTQMQFTVLALLLIIVSDL